MSGAGLRRAALLLGACALIAIGALSVVERLTRERIENARAAAERAALAVVLPPTRYNNDPIADSVWVRAPQWLGREAPARIWRGRLGDRPSALAMETTAPEGYSGDIELLLGVDAAGTVIAARVTRHAETPGLGDPIERERSDWIESYNGRSLGDTPLPRWTVRREGGDFDSFSGATLTPRAIARGLGRTLAFLQRHGEAIWAAEPGARLHFEDAPDARD
ncbi:electron transport complex subunit RsxG [Aquimonas voraii]|uniref:Ion-translocating oxidoreductase complex subunit G n=1 Tax=Aquimonas voraii TaxID=265719 RepID=A0A1G6SLS5_9GAMM|nr:electron transport complex subunit RsxG [Aquimonas voraii]SDD17788.1 electron transport complex protein RnfG [Aquimonas voraii]